MRHPIYATKESVVECLKCVRNMFIPLMSALSIAYIGIIRKQDLDPSWALTWRTQFLERTKVHPQWLSDLESSCVCNIEIPRASGIIQASEFELQGSDGRSYAHLLCYLCYFNAPIMICWGPVFIDDSPYLNPLPKGEDKFFVAIKAPPRLYNELAPRKLIPRMDDIMALASHKGSFFLPVRSDQDAEHFPCLVPLSYPAKKALGIPSRFPPVVAHSSQRQDETWLEFFAHWDALDKAKEEKESEEEKSRRLVKISNSTKFGKRSKMKMYVWTRTDGFYICTLAVKSDYKTVFEDYSPRQKKYNSHRNKWDLCSDFNPMDAAPTYDSDNDDNLSPGFDDYGGMDNVLVQDTLSSAVFHESFDSVMSNDPSESKSLSVQQATSSSEPQASSIQEATLSTILPPLNSDELHQLLGKYLARQYGQPTFDHPPIHFHESAACCAAMRYGFILLPTLSESSSHLILPPQVSTILGCSCVADLHPQNCEEAERLTTFCTALATVDRTSDIPTGTCDLKDHRLLLHNFSFQCRIQCFKGVNYYFLHPVTRSNPHFFIVLRKPHSVLEIMRRGIAPSYRDLLVDRGITFHTKIPNYIRPLPSNGNNSPGSLGLGYRPLGYQPTLEDYASYEIQRNHFFQSPKAMCCLMKGGVVWRLAHNYVDVESVYDGLSAECLFNSLCLWDGSPGSPSYWDDDLTAEEMDLVLGVYKVETGKYQSSCADFDLLRFHSALSRKA